MILCARGWIRHDPCFEFYNPHIFHSLEKIYYANVDEQSWKIFWFLHFYKALLEKQLYGGEICLKICKSLSSHIRKSAEIRPLPLCGSVKTLEIIYNSTFYSPSWIVRSGGYSKYFDRFLKTVNSSMLLDNNFQTSGSIF